MNMDVTRGWKMARTPHSLETDRGETFDSPRELPWGVQRAIFQDALLMHMWQRQQKQIQWWIEPIFDTWRKIAYYEGQWPGSTEPVQPGRATVVWEP